jgi:hypothetical protein
MRRIGRPGRQDGPGASSCSLPFEPVLAYRLPDQRRATLRTISSAPCSTPARPVPAPFSRKSWRPAASSYQARRGLCGSGSSTMSSGSWHRTVPLSRSAVWPISWLNIPRHWPRY